jgi:hypothetical protein
MLRELANDLWVTERPQRFLGAEIGTHMTVVRLASGALLCHSPVEPDPVLRGELDERGEVRFVVCPNRFHHLYAGAYRDVYPGVEIYVAPGLERKREDLAADGVLHDTPDKRWAEELDQHLVRGMPMLNEIVFLHRASRTLLLTDLAFHVTDAYPPRTQRLLRWVGARGFGPTWVERFLVIRDRAETRRSLQQLLRWDFDRVVVAHGEVLEHGGRAALAEGYRWLLHSEAGAVG